MGFSVLSWNVEHFKGNGDRIKRVADHIKAQDPDVFALFEIENLNLLDLIRNHFSGYDFHITDGPETQEIMVAHRKDKFEQVIFTQKREFQAYNPHLRPGALLSVIFGGKFYNMLFLHTDSGTTAPDFGNRAEMFEKIWSLKKALDKRSQPNPSNLIVMGDLNTMGLQFPTKKKKDQRVSEAGEIEALRSFAGGKKIAMPVKEFDLTFNNGSLISNLDHALVSVELPLEKLGTRQDTGEDYFVTVRGWQQLQGDEQKTFIETISDHCSLFLKVAG